MTVLGIGLDLVTVSDFAEQVERSGTTMLAEAFTSGERRYCEGKAADRIRSYAARWAAKPRGWTRSARACSKCLSRT